MNRATRRHAPRLGYRLIPTDSVPAPLREAARLALRFARADLNLPRHGFGWVEAVEATHPQALLRAPAVPVGGWALVMPDGLPQIALRAGAQSVGPLTFGPVTVATVASAALHEAQHLRDFLDMYAERGDTDLTAAARDAHEGESERRAVAYQERNQAVVDEIARLLL
jgi:hypothetical protein